MKRLLAVLVMFLGLASVSHAGGVKDQPPLGGYNYTHGNQVIGTSNTVSGINYFSMAAPGTSQGQNCQTCLTKLIMQLTQASTAYILESGTTDYVLYGSAIGASTGALGNTLVLTEEHLGPLCFQAGNTGIINILPVTGSNPASVNYEGYVDCGGNRN